MIEETFERLIIIIEEATGSRVEEILVEPLLLDALRMERTKQNPTGAPAPRPTTLFGVPISETEDGIRFSTDKASSTTLASFVGERKTKT